jgi:hypothetical protein
MVDIQLAPQVGKLGFLKNMLDLERDVNSMAVMQDGHTSGETR